jgi:vitamin B12 transporter
MSDVARLLPLACLLAASGAVAQEVDGGVPGADSTPKPWESVVTGRRELAVDGERFGAYAQLATALRLEPRVDLQNRGVGEASSDVVVRGGTFESTGLSLGAVAVLDPQTGHYLAELPVPLTMVTSPELRVGAGNAFHGLSANSGSVAFGWSYPRPQVLLSMAVGPFGQNQQHAYLARGWALGREMLFADLDVARGAGSASLPNTDFAFARAALRLRLEGEGRATDVFVGYQAKSFGWPYLYALRALHEAVHSSGAETEALSTFFVAVDHRTTLSSLGTQLQLSGYYRDHADDYELDRHQPGLFNPYRHRSRVGGLGALVRQPLSRGLRLRGAAQLLQDSLASSSITFGPYTSRRLFKLSLAAEGDWRFGAGLALHAEAGGALDDSNRDRPALSPLAAVTLRHEGPAGWQQGATIEYARATQLPGYTALGSSPAAGLFRGNPALGRATSDSFELGAWVERGARFRGSVALFRRFDRALTDWTYSTTVQPYAARAANPVDVAVNGVEAVVRGNFDSLGWQASYAFLSKSARYGAEVDASFYALNFPAHRAVLALTWRPVARVELKSDTEFRVQAPNALRSGPTAPLLASLGLVWKPQSLGGVALRASVDNLANVPFERVPGVPGAGRLYSIGVEYAQPFASPLP